MLTMLDNLFWDARALRLATQPGERVPLCCFAAEKLTHTHTIPRRLLFDEERPPPCGT